MANNGIEPTFFYSNILNTCSARGFTLLTPNITRNGDVCAYIDAAPITNLWACPVVTEQCWTVNKTCGGGSSTVPSTGQILCNGGNGNLWCCNSEFEECTTDGTINECWAKTFKNPMYNVDAAVADEIASSAVSAGLIGALTTVATALSTKAATSSITAITSIPTTAPISESSLRSTVSGSAQSASSPSTTASTSSGTSSKSSSLSGGAIAGIVIAAVAVVAFLGICFFFLRRRRGRKLNNAQELPYNPEVKEAQPLPPPTVYHELEERGAKTAPMQATAPPPPPPSAWTADSTPVSTWDPTPRDASPPHYS